VGGGGRSLSADVDICRAQTYRKRGGTKQKRRQKSHSDGADCFGIYCRNQMCQDQSGHDVLIFIDNVKPRVSLTYVHTKPLELGGVTVKEIDFVQRGAQGQFVFDASLGRFLALVLQFRLPCLTRRA
jgi:hypothetical protein